MTSNKEYGKDAVSIKEEKEKKMEKINIVEKIGEIKKSEYLVLSDYVNDKLNNNEFNIIYTNNDNKISIITNDNIIIELTKKSMAQFNIHKAYLAGKIGDPYTFKKMDQWDNLFISLPLGSPFLDWLSNYNNSIKNNT